MCTVEQLIEVLKKLPPKTEVNILEVTFEYGEAESNWVDLSLDDDDGFEFSEIDKIVYIGADK